MDKQELPPNYFDESEKLNEKLESAQGEVELLMNHISAVEAKIGYSRDQAADELATIEAKQARLAATEAKLLARHGPNQAD
eukprot:COSAG05_NODE_6967_length_873_cov_1.462532_1_plen_81_part_00